MSELTKEFFQEQLKSLATKKDLKNLATKTEQDELAGMVQNGFEEMSSEFKIVNRRMDGLDERVRTLDTKVDRALYTGMSNLEARVKRLEEKTGIKK